VRLGFVTRVTAGADAHARLPMIVAVHGLGDRPEDFATLFDALPFAARVVALRGVTPYGDGFTWFPPGEADRDPAAFLAQWAPAEEALTARLTEARNRVREVAVSDQVILRAATLCQALGTDGLRGELTLMRAARAAAALSGHGEVSDAHLKQVATLALRHRLRRNVLDEVGSTVRVERALTEAFAA
jgi:hypothetical protein